MSIIGLIFSTLPLTVAQAETKVGDFGFRIYKLERTHPEKRETTKAEKSVQDNVSRQLACLARNVFYEAGGEPMKGQIAVAQVTINRARSGLFPNDLCAVVAQHSWREGVKICQFSWYCDDSKNKKMIISKNNSSYIAAKQALLEGKQVEKIDHTVFYFHRHDVEVNPKWPHRIATKIGNHVFYRRQK